MTSPIQQLRSLGQSLWLDNLQRGLITSGELARLRDEGVTGITSNPTIFEKAIGGSTDYDEALVRLANEGRQPEDILWELMLEDIRAAADVFRPVYDATEGADGYVSIEVSPRLARDTQGTAEMARDLFRRAGRPNVMIKIPATEPGLPAIRQMLSEGVNVNVTLIFAVERYRQVVEAFLSGLEDLRARGGDLAKVASVASFFVSRLDTKVDRLLDARIADTTDPSERTRLQALLGKAGIANSKRAYQEWRRLHAGPRWEALRAAGARPQRCLWASTSTKDPRYPDTMYVEELIGPETVDTVPDHTLAAFRSHGEVRRSLDEGIELAEQQLQALAELGIDLGRITQELEVEGVAAFERSYESLLATLERASLEIRAGRGPRQWRVLGALQPAVDEAIGKLQEQDAPRRVWAKEASFWVPEAEPGRWMGWLTLPEQMLESLDLLLRRAEEAREYADVVLLGMGGSSLCPDVLRNLFGPIEGHPRLHVLDTTDPGTVLALRRGLDLERTLFIAASKSGTTTETLSHLAYFWQETLRAGVRSPGHHFAAITDAGTELERIASERGFRWTFLNPPDVGGRYSALSYFGLVPGAMMGVDVQQLLERAREMSTMCGPSVPVARNPGIWLGATLGRLAELGRDKLTLLMSPPVASFGSWLEQLLAESTGKEGRGIVPVADEPPGPPDVYGDDRLFVQVRLGQEDDAVAETLERAGRPVVTLVMRDLLDLGGEFLRWEIATAVAGAMLGINPFDQPNVQESKDNTRRLLAEYTSSGHLPAVEAVPAAEAGPALVDLLGRAPRGAYLAIMAYTARTQRSEAAIARIRQRVRDATRMATTAGYGPRFLHSTGQLHKGGPPTGLFLQVVQEDVEDVPIPQEPYGFSILKQAQALGDLQSLRARGYPILRVQLGRSPEEGWQALAEAIERSIGR
jgi:transaldolase/glucose-6-phosphate isomerase